jgi:uncharacterized protein (TIGR02145 family)
MTLFLLSLKRKRYCSGMNNFFGLIILLIACNFTVNSQDVIVSLTAQECQTPVELNYIYLENLTNASQVMLSNLPAGITTYRLNLSKGIILGENDHPGNADEIQVLCNRPGLLKLLLNISRKESIEIAIYDLSGRQIRKKSVLVDNRQAVIEITAEKNQALLVNLRGTTLRFGTKLLGDGKGQELEIVFSSGTSPLKNSETSFPESINTRTDFIYSPGDVVRFTAFKAGYYQSSIVRTPQNEDSYTLYVSRPCPATPVVSDFDDNVYYTVQIGTQCWMRENLNSTHYADGTPLVDGTGAGPIFGDYTTPYWFNYDDSVHNSLTYGKLYTWAAVMHGAESSNSVPSGVQGICPDGWHVPSDEEWIVLELFLGMSENVIYLWEEWRGTDEGGKLKEPGTIHWVSPNTGATNESGFAALPGGLRNNEGIFMAKKYSGYFTSTTLWPGTNCVAFRMITRDLSMIWRDFGYGNFARSVRCLKND